MPRGPKGEKRPADAIGNAIMIAKIATGEIEDITTEDGKNAAAVALGRMGGKARAEGLSAKKRKEIAKRSRQSPLGVAVNTVILFTEIFPLLPLFKGNGCY